MEFAGSVSVSAGGNAVRRDTSNGDVSSNKENVCDDSTAARWKIESKMPTIPPEADRATTSRNDVLVPVSTSNSANLSTTSTSPQNRGMSVVLENRLSSNDHCKAPTTTAMASSAGHPNTIQKKPSSATRVKELSRITPSPSGLLLDPNSSHSSASSKMTPSSFQSPRPTNSLVPARGITTGSSSKSCTSRFGAKNVGILAHVPMLGETGKSVSLRVVTLEEPMTFPQILDTMVTEGTARSSNAVHWTTDGAAFVVDHTCKDELAELLVKYFSHANYTSLQRQLNIYGFKKHMSGKYQGAFHNPHFHRDKCGTAELSVVKRNTPRRSPSTSPRPPKRSASPKLPQATAHPVSVQRNQTQSRRVSVSPADSEAPKNTKTRGRSRSRSRTPPPRVRAVAPNSAKKPKTTRIKLSMKGATAKSNTKRNSTVTEKKMRPLPRSSGSQVPSKPSARPAKEDSFSDHNQDLQNVAMSMYNHDSVEHLDWDIFGSDGPTDLNRQPTKTFTQHHGAFVGTCQASNHSSSDLKRNHASPSTQHPSAFGFTFQASKPSYYGNYHQYQYSGHSQNTFYPSQQSWHYFPPIVHPDNQTQSDYMPPSMMKHPGASLHKSRPSAEDFAKVLEEISSLSSPMAKSASNYQGISEFLAREEKMMGDHDRNNEVASEGAIKMTVFTPEGEEKSPIEVSNSMFSPVDVKVGQVATDHIAAVSNSNFFMDSLEDPRGVHPPRKEKAAFSPLETDDVTRRMKLINQLQNANAHIPPPQHTNMPGSNTIYSQNRQTLSLSSEQPHFLPPCSAVPYASPAATATATATAPGGQNVNNN